MKCPICGEVNEGGYRFCRACGHAITDAEAGAIGGAPPKPASGVKTAPSVSTVAPASESVAYRLVATSGILSGRNFNITTKGLIVGRDQSKCQVVLIDDQISRQHAWIGLDESGQVVLRDQGSSNGSFINRARVKEGILKPNDEITFGPGAKHSFRIESFVPAGPTIAMKKAVGDGEDGSGHTSVVSETDIIAAQRADNTAGGTVAIKLTDLMARPHLDLIVDKFAVKSEDIPDKGLIVGRDPGRCAIVLDHASVSSVHAEFAIKGGGIELTDNSANGTFVNGIRVKTAQLHDGDYITFGRYSGRSLIFRSGLEHQLKMENIDLTKDHLIIGRDPSCDVCIPHPVVSKRHAEIVKQNGKTLLIDLGSVNGTFVNGIRVKRHELQDLDRVVIGPSELHFRGGTLVHVPDGRVVRLDSLHLNFQVTDQNTGKPKLLLDDLSLVVRPKELIGLLGPSGAGKTTLMNALNGFIKPTAGKVLYNGVDLYQNLDAMKSTIGYVPQEDIMHRQLTVRQCLFYAGRLRLPDDISDDEINHRVEEMLDTLKLDPQRWDNPVATLSGGQRKRVSLGIELLPKPGVLFLDEPTAGLDPRTETLMMMLFRQLANQGSTIVITTHLLGSFGVLDKVVVLVQGRLAYYGPGTKFLEYFKAESPPDVYDDLTDNNTVPYALELKQRFQTSPLYQSLMVEPQQQIPSERAATPAGPPVVQAPRKNSGFRQFNTLLQRTWQLKFSDTSQTILLFAQAPIIALLVAMMAGKDAHNQVQTIFMAMFAALWFGCSNAVREIVDEQTIYKRERQTGLKIIPYIMSKLTVLSIVALVQCFSVVLILVVGRRALDLQFAEVGAAILIMFLVAVNGSLIGLLISSLVSTPDKALTLFPLVLIPELLLCGLFMPAKDVPSIIPVTMGQAYVESHPRYTPQVAESIKKIVQPCEGVPYADFGAANGSFAPAGQPPDSTAMEESVKGLHGHDVAAALIPQGKVLDCFHRFTLGTGKGMPLPIEWLSKLAVSRWGLEALADLCVHGTHSTGDAAYKIVNTISISLHPDDSNSLLNGLDGPPDFPAHLLPGESVVPPGPGQAFPLESHFLHDKGPYLAILAGYAMVMLALILIVMKARDVK